VPLAERPPQRHDGEHDVAAGRQVGVRRGAHPAVVPLWRSFGKRHSMPEQLRRTGARRTAWIAPDEPSLRAIGRNVLDPAMRMGAARAGREQGRRMAAEVSAGWPAAAR